LKIKEPLEYPIVVDIVLASLLNPDANVSAAALDTLRKVKGVEERPDFKTSMDKLQSSTNPRLKLIATSVLQGKNLGDALRDVQPGSVLDFNYFVTKVEPILARPGAMVKHASSATPAMSSLSWSRPTHRASSPTRTAKRTTAMPCASWTSPIPTRVCWSSSLPAHRQLRQRRRLPLPRIMAASVARQRIKRTIPHHS